MKILSTLLPASLLVLASCSGGGGSAPAVGVVHGDSTGTPLPGSTVGNWELETIAVIQDTGVPSPMRAGMNLRLSKAGVEVLLDEYIGPGSMLPDVMNQFYGEYQSTGINDPEKGFELTLTLDFSKLFHAKPRSFYHTIYAKGTLVADKMNVDYLLREWLIISGVPTEVGRDELTLTFMKGTKVEMTPGTWAIDNVMVVADTDPKNPLLFPAPIPKRVGVGDKLIVGATEITTLFGGDVTKAGFAAAQPDLLIDFHDAHVGNAVAQGFLAIEGKPAQQYNNQGAVVEFNFYHTGKTLVGDLKGAWAADLGKSPTHLYHVYLTLSPSKFVPFGLEGADADLMTDGGLDLSSDVFGIRDPEALQDRLVSYGVDLPSSR